MIYIANIIYQFIMNVLYLYMYTTLSILCIIYYMKYLILDYPYLFIYDPIFQDIYSMHSILYLYVYTIKPTVQYIELMSFKNIILILFDISCLLDDEKTIAK